MIRESLIRSLPEIAFALLFGGGLILGGDAALASLPKVLDAAMPNMAAQARQAETQRLEPAPLAQTPDSSFNGSEKVVGGIIIIPMLINTVATTRSIKMKGTKIRKPI